MAAAGGFSRTKLSLLSGIAVITLVVDQWTKYLVHTKFSWGESLPILPGFFSLTYVRNKGAAFGLFHRAPEAFRDPFFIVVPVLAMVIILALFYRLRDNQKITATALCLILSGAIGNLIDRVRFGYVIDFLDFYVKSAHWPAFNVADACIVVGVGVMLVQSFFEQSAEIPSKPKRST